MVVGIIMVSEVVIFFGIEVRITSLLELWILVSGTGRVTWMSEFSD